MAIEGDYEPGAWDWVNQQVEAYEASGGREGTVFYVGNTMSLTKRLWKWTEGMAAWQQLVPGGGAGQAESRIIVRPVYQKNVRIASITV